ncbi:MAG TPA: tetratricopeptide repeat protein [Chitinophagales bacterium]|nr:tetratricopeptide repeat protein [Chitinophagales bacterium]HMY42831.1 tetratricopeptide repeat protein [Chitinophagales bacterium]HNE86571.1 tetratricopeptide repeat protein [Chitinophagales bacterium]
MNKLALYLCFFVFAFANHPLAFSKGKKAKNKKGTNEVLVPKTTKEILAIQSIFIEGIQADLLGNKKDAIAKYNEVIRLDANNDAAYYELAKLYYSIGDLQQTVFNSQKAIKINPNNEYYYIYLAEALGEAGMYAEASKTYESLIKLKPKEYDYYYDWAYMLSQAKKNDEAINVLNLLETKVGVNEDLIMLKQPLWIQQNKVEDAVKDIDKLIALFPREEMYYLNKAEIYATNNLPLKAISTYENLLKTHPESADALLGLAELYRKENNTTKQQEYLNQLFNNPKIDIDSKIMAIIPMVEKMGSDSTYDESLLKIVSLINKNYPNNMKAIAAKADVLYNMDKKEEALNEYIKLVHQHADSLPGTIWIHTYILASELQKMDTLIDVTERAIKVAPDDAFAYFYNAIAHQQKKQNQEAAISIKKGLQNIQKSGLSVYNSQLKLQSLIVLGDISYELKDYTSMDSAYNAALEIDPNNSNTLNNYAYYLSERDVNLVMAERMSKKANLLEDDNSAFMDTYAWIMYKMKNYKEALIWIEDALKLPGANQRSELIEHYGDILIENGRKDDAIIQWNKAIELGGDKEVIKNKINKYK